MSLQETEFRTLDQKVGGYVGQDGSESGGKGGSEDDGVDGVEDGGSYGGSEGGSGGKITYREGF